MITATIGMCLACWVAAAVAAKRQRKAKGPAWPALALPGLTGWSS